MKRIISALMAVSLVVFGAIPQPPFVDKLNQSIADAITSQSKSQADYYAKNKVYQQFDKPQDITPVGITGTLTYTINQYATGDKVDLNAQGYAYRFQYVEHSGLVTWVKGQNSIVQKTAEAWRTFDWQSQPSQP